jgi:hypothetical protein
MLYFILLILIITTMNSLNSNHDNCIEIPLEHYLSLINISDLSNPHLSEYSINTKKNKTPNSFMIFRMKVIKTIRKQKLNLNMRIISKISGELWKQLSKDVKEKYEKISLSIKEKHLQEKMIDNRNENTLMFENTLNQLETQPNDYQYYDYSQFMY